MADQINLIPNLQSLFFVNTATMLGLDPTASATQSMIRQTWPQQGAPGFTIDDDWVFLRIVPLPGSSYNKIRDVVITENEDGSINQATGYTRVWQIFWECYGPNSGINAINIRDQLFYDTINDLFAASNLYMVTDVDDATRVPEALMGQWWERWDVSAQFYESVIRNSTATTISDIQITISNPQNTSTITESNE